MLDAAPESLWHGGKGRDQRLTMAAGYAKATLASATSANDPFDFE